MLILKEGSKSSKEGENIWENLHINSLMAHQAWSDIIQIKGYLRYKTIFCHKVALDVYLMNFFMWRKNNVSFSRYQNCCVFVKAADFKIFDVIISITG